MEVATLFLILASDITMTILGLVDALIIILSWLSQWCVLLSLEQQSTLWKRIWLENVLINLFPGKSSLFRELNDEKTLLR